MASVHDRLIAYLQEAHAFQEDVLSWVRTTIATSTDRELTAVLRAHGARTEGLIAEIARRLGELGAGPSLVKRAAFRVAALGKNVPYRLRKEKAAKNLRDAYITAAMATSGFALLEALARRDGDDVTATLATRGREAQVPLSQAADAGWDRAVGIALADEGIAAG
ncbi:MAG: DUF892 family protein [Actinobacteria bacterium]|nr:DUF892 family protein [Actinomycetota bacterium]